MTIQQAWASTPQTEGIERKIRWLNDFNSHAGAGQGSYACISCVDRESGLPFYDSLPLAFALGDLRADYTVRLKRLQITMQPLPSSRLRSFARRGNLNLAWSQRLEFRAAPTRSDMAQWLNAP